MKDFIQLLDTLKGLRELQTHVAEFSHAPYGKAHARRLETITRAISILECQHGLRSAVNKKTGEQWFLVGMTVAGHPVLTKTGEPLELIPLDDFQAEFDCPSNPLNERMAAMEADTETWFALVNEIAVELDPTGSLNLAGYLRSADVARDMVMSRLREVIAERHRFAAGMGAAQANERALRSQVGRVTVVSQFVACMGCDNGGKDCAAAGRCKRAGETEEQPTGGGV